MFEDRTKNGSYDFNKIDSAVRTKVITETKRDEQNMTDAQKKLFSPNLTKNENKPQSILPQHKSINVENLPSSKYIQSFGKNTTVDEVGDFEEVDEVKEQVIEDISQEETNINFDELIEEVSEVKVNDKVLNKELKNITPSPKKSYSFRIKLVTGVYCILVALFGGWVIGNAIDIAHTNASLYETVVSNQELNAEIAKIVLKIKNFDNASKNPDDVGITTEIATEVIDTIPEDIIEPNEYVVQSNWFDILCNWLARIFGF